MVAPPGAVEMYNGYPIIDPATINPELDWPAIESAQGDWLDGRVIENVADETELTIRFSGLGATGQRLVGVRSDKTLRWWSGTAWVIVATGGSLAQRASYSANWSQVSDGTPLAIGSGTEIYRWRRNGVDVSASGTLIRGTSTNFGGAGIAWAWTLPIAPRDYRLVSGSGHVTDASTGAEYPVVVKCLGGSTIVLVLTGSGKRVGNAVSGSPLPTFAVDDQITWDVTYEGVA